MKVLFLFSLLALASCGVSVDSGGEGDLPGDRNSQDGQCLTRSCVPEVKKPKSSLCKNDFLGDSIVECKTQSKIGELNIITKDKTNNPIFQFNGSEFIFSTLTKSELTGKDHEQNCKELQIEKYYQQKYTKFQLISAEQLTELISQSYDNVFNTVEGNLIIQNKDNDGWNRVVEAVNGSKVGHTHPNKYKYKSLCIAYPNIEFSQKKIYIEYNWGGDVENSIYWLGWGEWLSKNKERLAKKSKEVELELAKKRCLGEVIRIKESSMLYTYEDDEWNTGSYRIYGNNESTFKCK